MKTIRSLTILPCFILSLFTPQFLSAVPHLIHYQGRVAVDGITFDGEALFKFALVDATGKVTYWSHDDTSVNGSEPVSPVVLQVVAGLYSVLLGEESVENMKPLPADVFNNDDLHLRVWFEADGRGSVLLSPDQRITAAAYAIVAGNAQSAQTAAYASEAGVAANAQTAAVADAVTAGNITSAMLADGAVDATKLAVGAVEAQHLGAGVVEASHLAAGAAAANLADSGFNGVPSGGMILSPMADPTLTDAGYLQAGAIISECWLRLSDVGAPSPRSEYASAMADSFLLIIWGGVDSEGNLLNDGAIYDRRNNTWRSMSTVNAPTARKGHSAAVLSDGQYLQLIIWGGEDASGYCNTGARYYLESNVWVPIETDGAPTARANHGAVSTGNNMVIWGGENGSGNLASGGLFNYVLGWSNIKTTDAPPAASGQAILRGQGRSMFVFGGRIGTTTFSDQGGEYNSVADSWAPFTASGVRRTFFSGVWTGTEAIIWGGWNLGELYNDGYKISTSGYSRISSVNAPSARRYHFSVWTGSEMIVWGGRDSGPLNTGSRYDPVSDSWIEMIQGGPDARYDSAAFWSSWSNEMLMWGGRNDTNVFNDLWSYSPQRTLYLYLKP